MDPNPRLIATHWIKAGMLQEAAARVAHLWATRPSAHAAQTSRTASYRVDDLEDYLQSGAYDRGFELALGWGEEFKDWVQRTYRLGELDEELDEIIEGKIPYLDEDLDLPPEVLEAWYASGQWERSVRGDLAYAPSWYLMAKPKSVHTKLIHFTNRPEAVASQGFKHGEPDKTRLSLTHHLEDSGSGAGFNFAYDVKDWEKYAKSSKGGFKYGTGAVVFHAQGLKVWHKGGREPQVIFWGPAAVGLVPIVRGPEGWMANGSTYPTLKEAVEAA